MPLSKAERKDGWRSAPTPNDHQTAILRRVARGHITATCEKRDDDKESWSFAYDDATPVRDTKGFPLDEYEFRRMLSAGWLLQVEGQDGHYRARNASDPVLPRIFKKQKPVRTAKRVISSAVAADSA